MYLEIIEILLRGFCVGVAASITVGPVAVLCIQRTLSKSRRSGIVSGLGVAAADTLMAMIAYFWLLDAPGSNRPVQPVAACGRRHLRSHRRRLYLLSEPGTADPPQPAGKTSLTQDFASIFGLTIANFVLVIPYILTFFAVFKISTIETFDVAGLGRGFLVIVGFFGGAILWWTSLAFLINLFRRRFRPRHMLTINHVAGIIIGVLGVYTILSTFFNLIPHGMLQALKRSS